jgi:hypothetical protein
MPHLSQGEIEGLQVASVMKEIMVPRGDVTATVRYGIKDGNLYGFGQAPADEQPVILQDLRDKADQPTLAGEGFELVSHVSAVTDFEDRDAVATTYLPEIRDLMRTVMRTPHVYMQSNWVVRAETKPFSAVDRGPTGNFTKHQMKTGGFLHIDYDSPGAAAWARRAMDDAGVSRWPGGRLVVLTAWRAISAPPQDKPLAFIDRRSVSPDDLILETIPVPTVTWNGYQLKRNASHRFCWWSNVNRDEVILFAQHEDGFGPVSAAPHTAFHDPTCPPDTPTRHSIEVRGYCFVQD